MKNSHKIILDLCGGSGNWSRYYKQAKYDVRIIDMPLDVRLLYAPNDPIYGILAAPPCTVFASSGARWKRSKEDFINALSVVDACLRLVIITKPKFWALENPIGRLSSYLGKPRLYFNPCDFGDPYTKRTCLLGDFNFPKHRRVNPVMGSMMHLNKRSAKDRSLTPLGFAKAFFEANR